MRGWLSTAARWRVLGKSPVGAYLRLNEALWGILPESVGRFRVARWYGVFLQELVRLRGERRQFFGTFFLRNRAQLELIRRICDRRAPGSALDMAVLGCSNGAEVYSLLWTIRSARPDLKVAVRAVDVSPAILEMAKAGLYSVEDPGLVEEPFLERVTAEEMRQMFDREGDRLRIKPEIKDGVTWHVGDAADPEVLKGVSRQDIVVANNFLCHMPPAEAERCLRNIGRLVKPGGYVVISGVDLDVRTMVAREQGWRPVPDLLAEIHEGDPILRRGWPFRWWGLEPLDGGRPDWMIRYASVFQVGAGEALSARRHREGSVLEVTPRDQRVPPDW